MLQAPEDINIDEAVRHENWPLIRQALADLHPADIAELIAKTNARHQRQLFALVEADRQSDVLAELEHEDAAEEIIETLSSLELRRLIDQMAPDDAADVLGELPDDETEEVLALMEQEDSRDLRQLMRYPEDSAGGIMTTDVVSMLESQTVADAINAIAHMDEREKFYTANVVGPEGVMFGYIDIWDLLREPNANRPLSDLMNQKFVSVTAEMDQEDVAKLMAKYNLDVLPVLDDDGILLGRITADDVLDVIEEEASEDIFMLAGSDDAELDTGSIFSSCAARLPWLLITLLGGFFTSLILQAFHAHIHEAIVLAAFVPIVLAMGGNTGIQSSTLVVRSIALGNEAPRHMGRWLGRELATGATMGLICGTIVGAWAHLVVQMAATPASTPPLKLALVVGLALFAAMTFAASFGAFVPTVLQRLRIDPAVASGPFVSITNDIAALLIYYGVTILLIIGT
ncbi:MAG: magnesium transporter [Candidatus Promineifilaceae bacterium]|jgi:magnesium transporter